MILLFEVGTDVLYTMHASQHLPLSGQFALFLQRCWAGFHSYAMTFGWRIRLLCQELSKFVWILKHAGLDPVTECSIVRKAKPYTSGAKQCQLSLTSKRIILQADPDTTLNKRYEFLGNVDTITNSNYCKKIFTVILSYCT